ncbi:asparagine synthase (glutamine-hydrolyzing) [Candidatus Zixiibacteriota bacterium]
MSGIAGIWHLDGKPVDPGILSRMSETLAHRGPDADGMWIEGSVGLCTRLFRITPESADEIQPFVHNSGVAIVFDGRVDNREELLADIERSPQSATGLPDSGLVIEHWLSSGEASFSRMKGDYAFAIFDPRKPMLLLVRDRFGIKPLYYHRHGETIIFASEIKAILACPGITTRPDEVYLSRHLLRRNREETWERTFFEGMVSLPPAHYRRFIPDKSEQTRYWDLPDGPPIILGSHEEYVSAFRELFEQAVRRRLRSSHPVAVSVSGGLDSTSVFSMARMLSAGTPDVQGITYASAPGTASDELAYIEELEQDAGVSIHRVPVKQSWSIDAFTRLVHRVESPFLDELLITSEALFEEVNQIGARVVLSGHWADQFLFDQAYLVDRFRRLKWGEIRRHLKSYERWYCDADARVFRRRFRADMVKYALPSRLIPIGRSLRPGFHQQWFTRGFRKAGRLRSSSEQIFRSRQSSNHARSLYEQIRSGHHVLCLEWESKMSASYGIERAYPFLDSDLISFLMRIPGEVLHRGGVPKGLLRDAMGEDIPRAVRVRNWKADFTWLVNDVMEQAYPELLRHLDGESQVVARGYLDQAVLQEKLAIARADLEGYSSETAWGFSGLLGLELWLRVWFGEYTIEK